MAKVFVRSLMNLGDYNDDESYKGCVSIVDKEGVESMEVTVGKLIRGEPVNCKPVNYKGDLIKNSVEDILEMLDPTQSAGFDLSDAHKIKIKAEQSKKQAEIDKKEKMEKYRAEFKEAFERAKKLLEEEKSKNNPKPEAK